MAKIKQCLLCMHDILDTQSRVMLYVHADPAFCVTVHRKCRDALNAADEDTQNQQLQLLKDFING